MTEMNDIPILYVYNFLFLIITLFLCEIKIIPKKFYGKIILVYFLFVFGQRWFGGVDFRGYLEGFLLNNRHFEIGYLLFQELFKKYNIYFGNLIFVIYLFTTLTSIWFIKKYTYSNYIIFLFFLTEYHIMSINPLRIYIAINIFLIGYYFFDMKNKKIGIIIMLFSIFFHKLSIGAILVFFVFNIFRMEKAEKLLLLYLIVIPLLDIKILLERLVYLILPEYLHYFGGYFDQKLSFLNVIRYYFMLLVFIYFRKYMNTNIIKEKKLIKNTYIFFILIGSATSFAPLHRVAYFFKIFEFLFLAYIFDLKKINKLKKTLIMFIFILNYIVIGFKDMGVLFNYELRFLQIYNTKSKEEYLKESSIYLKNYLFKFKD